MENNTYFRINSVEELKEAYNHFKDEWISKYPIEKEIYFFKLPGETYRFISKYKTGISLQQGIHISHFKEVPNPFKFPKELHKRLKELTEAVTKKTQPKPTFEKGCNPKNMYEKIYGNYCSADYSYIIKEKKYQVEIKGVEIDVYDVLKAFDINCPATQHAIKKLLKAGKRGYKNAEQDLDEAIKSINRAKELQND